MNNICEFHEECEDYHRDNQKCVDNTAPCAMKFQLQHLKGAN